MWRPVAEVRELARSEPFHLQFQRREDQAQKHDGVGGGRDNGGPLCFVGDGPHIEQKRQQHQGSGGDQQTPLRGLRVVALLVVVVQKGARAGPSRLWC